MIKWEIEFNVPFGDAYKPVQIYTHDGHGFEIFVDNGREGTIAWMRRGWKFHAHPNTSITTADFIIIADIIEEHCPFEFKTEWLAKPTASGRWPLPPRLIPLWPLMTYPKWPKVRHW